MADKRRFVIVFVVLTILCGFATFLPLGGQAIAETWFGIQGSISGETYLVGQRLGDGIAGAADDYGSVHVFVRDAESWPETTTLESLLEPGSLGIGAEFGGGAVLIDADTAVVGAYRNTVGEEAQSGNAFIFTRSDSIWSPQSVLEMPGGAVENARFGVAGDIDGDRLLLSASGSGNAYIFTRSGQEWDSGIELSGGDIGNPIGVAIDGDLAAVGNYGSNPHVDLWRYNQTSGAWDFDSAIANYGEADDNLFAAAIDISGNTMVISARQEAVDESARAGVVYVYEYDGENWSDPKIIANPNPAVNDEFGYDVAIDGDRLLIGAPRDDTNGNDAGLAYLFQRTGSEWTLVEEPYSPAEPEAGKWFGEIVDLSENVLLVGGPGRTADPVGSGDVFWFDLEGAPPGPDIPGDANLDGEVNGLDATILAENWQKSSAATWSEGDFNGDGMVNDSDAAIMVANWLKSQTSPATATVPEPGAFALLLVLACCGLFGWLKK